jgi:hypothetical protein
MPRVQDYYPSTFLGDQQAILQWMLSRQQAQNSNWEAGVLETGFPATTEPGAPYVTTTPPLVECSIIDLLFAEALAPPWFTPTLVENILMLPPAGQALDNQGGPDGFPVNYSPVGFGLGNMFIPTFPLTAGQISAKYAANVQLYDPYGRGVQMCTPSGLQTLHPLAGYDQYGYVLNPGATTLISDLRVDLFVLTDVFYYQSSAVFQGPFETGGACQGVQAQPSCFQSYLVPGGYWGAQITNPGLVVAVLYPASVPQPASGWYGATLPAGWLCHSNTGIGQKLSNYFARIYSKTDIEYIQEDNIPIIVQDSYHARCGSSVVPAPGEVTLHILYNDPVLGVPVLVYTSLAGQSELSDLPLSFIVPTSDPLYVPDTTQTNCPAFQNRSYIYDCALGIITFTASGNFHAAAEIIQELNGLLNVPGYLPSIILENAEDGSTARWTPANGTVANVAANSMTPEEPPYGDGKVIEFTSTAMNATFTYVGSGFPDATDIELSFESMTPAKSNWQADISVTTAAGSVTDVQVNTQTPAAPAYNSSTKQIIISVGVSLNWRTELVPLASLVSSLAGDTLTAITGFAVTLPANAKIFYLDNLSVGTLQPFGSLCFSYDTFYGIIDQAYIRAGSMAWVCYAYCVYMQATGDYTAAPALQEMLTFLLTLQSTAGDSTNGLFYLGYGKYMNPGYQYVPGKMLACSTEHQVDLYFALMRAATLLPTAAIQLYKTGTITVAEAGTLNATAESCANAAATLAANVPAVLYIAPASGLPGYFAQGVSSAGLDTSWALDCNTWGALFANAVGQQAIAEQCIEFVFGVFLLWNQQIVLSNAANSYNEAFQQLTTFVGVKPYADSAGGYSGSPSSVWQEGTWGLILALLDLYSDTTIQNFLDNLVVPGLGEFDIDQWLSTLIISQRTVWQTTGQSSSTLADEGSTLEFSLASRDLPYEFEVWPCFAGTAWYWLVSNAPGLLLTTQNAVTLLPNMTIPAGAGQTVDETQGASSLGTMTVECNDPTGILKQLGAEDTLIGKIVQFRQGFPNLNLGDFVTLHTMQITQVSATEQGKIVISLSDVQRFIEGVQIFKAGGPFAWAPGEQSVQPIGDAIGFNAFPVSDKNPRYVQGNPIRVALAVLQNECGVGQDPALLASNYILNQLAGVYATEQDYQPQPPPPDWMLYTARSNGYAYQFDDTTLINPNPYIDVDQWLALADSTFSGNRMEFKITRPATAKNWVQAQIFKPLGIYMICGADGKLRLKTLRPQPYLPIVFQFNPGNIKGIPKLVRQRVLNFVKVKTDVDPEGDSRSGLTTAARAYMTQASFEQQTSIVTYGQQLTLDVESTGLRVNYGGYLIGEIFADRVFRRHAFAPPAYEFTGFLNSAAVELGDLVSLSHPKLWDMRAGRLGLVNVTCEILKRTPNWKTGEIEYLAFDRRYLNVFQPYQIAPLSAGIPAWGSATQAEQQQYMFISAAATGGENQDGTPGNTIF